MGATLVTDWSFPTFPSLLYGQLVDSDSIEDVVAEYTHSLYK
jgi:hypothetical protein